MPTEAAPASLEELAETLRDCGRRKQTIEIGGNFTKRAMGGPIGAADVILSTRRLNRVLAYEPKDLTISVEAGLGVHELSETLEAQGQVLPLNPPFSETATVGGVVATNCSGPRRRRYGTARDMVIGMNMVTIEGKVVQSGGMVVKNVTGLDMAKLMVGSFGTLASIASVNFKVFPRPETERTFICSAGSLDATLALRETILASTLQPAAIDLLNPEAVEHSGCDLPAGYALMVQAGGNEATVTRYEREYERFAGEHGATSFVPLLGDAAAGIWKCIEDYTPNWLAEKRGASVLRLSATPKSLGQIFRVPAFDNGTPPIVARAGAAVGYVYCLTNEHAGACLSWARTNGLRAVVEYASPEAKRTLELWEDRGPELEIMRRIKDSLDPQHLLNPGRLFNRI